jgi:polyisoprenoid-binding protein YceI
VELASGTYEIGPVTGALTLHTGRSGFGAMVGHDLVIEVMRWHGTVRFDADRIDASTVEIVVDATSLEVLEGSGGAVPLLAINKSEIVKTINSKVLNTKKHREMRFVSSAVVGSGGSYTVRGNLTIAGTTRPSELAITLERAPARLRATISTSVVQSDFGIKPYSAMLGALKVRDRIDVLAVVELP